MEGLIDWIVRGSSAARSAVMNKVPMQKVIGLLA
jgi:hypothetical protein